MSSSLALGVVVTLIALVGLVPGLGDYGFSSTGELAPLSRARGALGVPLTALERSPVVPDLLRTWALFVSNDERVVRLPHALFAALTCGVTAGLARSLGHGVASSLLAGAFVLAFPYVTTSGRSLAGNPIGEGLGLVAILSGRHTLGILSGPSATRRLAWGLVTVGLLALSVAAMGLVRGGLLPMLAITLLAALRSPGVVTLALGIVTAATAGLALTLIVLQGDGYIPALGLSKDLSALSQPWRRSTFSSLREAAEQVFPWLPLAIMGFLLPRPRTLSPEATTWPALWCASAFAVTAVDATWYGRTPLPIATPVALTCVRALCAWSEASRGPSRRLALAFTAGMIWVLVKDAKTTPSRFAAPVHDFINETHYPEASVRFASLAREVGLAAIGGLVWFGLATRPRRSPTPAAPNTGPFERAWQVSANGAVGLSLLYQTYVFGHDALPRMAHATSGRDLVEGLEAEIHAGTFGRTLYHHRVRDRSFFYYADESQKGEAEGLLLEEVVQRQELGPILARPEPVAVVLLRSDLAPVHEARRRTRAPFFVLRADHHDLVWVSNTLPANAVDQNPIRAVLFDTPPSLANPTFVRFADDLELLGWELGEVMRGRPVTLRLAFHVLRTPRSNTKLQARLQRGASSRLNAMPFELLPSMYPVTYWRKDDYLVVEHTFEAPLLEVLPGAHELIVALKHGDQQNVRISEPTERHGAHGVVLRGNKHEYAVLGQVDVR